MDQDACPFGSYGSMWACCWSCATHSAAEMMGMPRKDFSSSMTACAVALAIGISGHDLLSTLYTVIWIGVVPLGALGISAWVGIFFPCPPMPLRFRWEHRRPQTGSGLKVAGDVLRSRRSHELMIVGAIMLAAPALSG